MFKTGEAKSAFILAAAAILLSAAGSAQAQAGPVGFWKGDDGSPPTMALDSSTGGNNGSYVGTATPTFVAPTLQFPNPSSFSFPGPIDMVNVPGFSWPVGGPITVAFWNLVITGTNSSAFSIGNVDTPNRCQAHAPWGDNVLYWDYGDLGTTGRISTNYAAYLNKWTHVALVSEGVGGAFKAIYLDGVLATSAASSDGPTIALTGVQIGAWTGPGLYHPGNIDDFRIYNRMLTTPQVQLLAAGFTEPVAPTGLVAVPGNNQITLVWNPVNGSTSYNVKRGLVPGGPYPTIIPVMGATNYVDMGLTNGTTYYYVVSAVGVSEGPDSAQASAAPAIPVPRATTVGNDKGRCGCAAIPPAGFGPLGWSLLGLAAVLAWGCRR